MALPGRPGVALPSEEIFQEQSSPVRRNSLPFLAFTLKTRGVLPILRETPRQTTGKIVTENLEGNWVFFYEKTSAI